MKLDDLLSKPNPSTPASERLRAAVFAELDAPAARGWRADVALLASVCALLTLVVGAAMVATGQVHPATVAQRAGPMLALVVIGAIGVFTALAPRRRGQVLVGLLLGAAAVVAVVLVRRSEGGQASAAPAWMCTISQLAVGAGPLVLALALLRKSAVTATRAALVGLAVGTTGAAIGELACNQSWEHVAVWHLAAWLGVATVAVLVSSRLRPRSFAP